jgi:hypothetical protein
MLSRLDAKAELVRWKSLTKPSSESRQPMAKPGQKSGAAAPPSGAPLVEVRLVTDEAEAVLAILNKRQAGQPVEEAEWQRPFLSEGYVRLKKRETSMGRSFSDSAFREFVLSEDLLKRTAALSATLESWKTKDLGASARRVLAYLPAETRIRASVYPVIKPQTNSFVFELTTNPAIFMYVDPEQSSSEFENMVAHEFHHVGLTSGCPATQQKKNNRSAFKKSCNGQGHSERAWLCSPPPGTRTCTRTA